MCSDMCSVRKNSPLFPNGASADGEVTGESSDHFTYLSDHFTYFSDHSTGLGKTLHSLRRPRQISLTTSLVSANCSDHFTGLGKYL